VRYHDSRGATACGDGAAIRTSTFLVKEQHDVVEHRRWYVALDRCVQARQQVLDVAAVMELGMRSGALGEVTRDRHREDQEQEE
jgi:hypothetical protein